MKKLFSILIAVVMIFSFAFVLTACNEVETVTVAMVTDVGDITDQSFNQSTWEAVRDYCEEFGIPYKYYRPSEDTNDARVANIEQAINEGAKIVVCPGYLFETAIYEVQDEHPDVKFVLLDGEPNDGVGDFETTFPAYKTADNVYCVLYQEEQAGYLAGYAAVKDGERKLGFLGGMAVPAVIRYGYGFVQGIQDAAVELNVNVEVWYAYGGQFFGDNEITGAMDTWYQEGVETVFACGGGIFTSVVEAINNSSNSKAKLIGVDVDQKATVQASFGTDVKVLTSAMKGLYDSTQTALKQFFGGNWDAIGGTTDIYGLNENDGGNEYVGLPRAQASWGFSTFTIANYDAIVAQLRSGAVTIDAAVDVDINAWLTAASKITNKGYTASIKS